MRVAGPLFWSSLIVIGYVALAGIAGLYMLRALRGGPGRADPEAARLAVFDLEAGDAADGKEDPLGGRDGRAR